MADLAAGATQVSTSIVLRNTSTSTEHTGATAATMTLSYWRQGGSRVGVTASDLAAITSVHTPGGVKEVDAGTMPGTYRVDWPNAAFAAGALWVHLTVLVSGDFAFHERFMLANAAGIADTVLRRRSAQVETSTVGDALATDSLYGLLRRAEKSSLLDAPGQYRIYRSDGVTILGDIPVATDANAEGITEFGG